MMAMKLIVLGSDWDVYQYAFRDFIENSKVCYIPTFRPKGLLGKIHRLLFNPRINKLINIPFKKSWTSYYFKDLKEDNYCFLILETWLRWESATGLLPYLRKKYPKSRIVCFNQDLLKRIVDLYTGEFIPANYLKNISDLVITYDTNDAARYGFTYFPTVFSPICSIKPKAPSDLYFLGLNKGRLPMLVEICRKAKDLGLKCNFIMLKVPHEEQIHIEGIHYVDTNVPYSENLANAAASGCIIEMLQPGASSATFRMWEAIMLNRKLITNSISVKSSPFFDDRYISTFTCADDFDWDFVRTPQKGFEANPFQENIRPEALVRFIEQRLNITIER